MKIINYIKTKFFKAPISNEVHYSWIIHHCRSTDRVFFGPFKSYKEIDDFFADPKNHGVQCSVELLISPNCPKEQYWYNPYDYLRDNHPYLFEREPEHATV